MKPLRRLLAPALLAVALAPAASLAQPATPAAAVIAEAARLDAEADRLYQADQLDQALAVAERELALTEKALGPKDPHTAGARVSVGGLWFAKGEYVKAEGLLLDAVAVLDHAPDADEREHGSALNNLAVLYVAKGRTAEARPLFERAIALLEGAKTPDPQSLATFYGAYAATLGEAPQALALLDKAIALQQKFGPERGLAISLVRKADLLRKMARPGAEEAYRLALELADRALGPDSLVAAQARRFYGRYFWGAGAAFDAGEHFYQSATTSLVKVLGAGHPTIADLLCEWASSKQLQGDLAGALDLRRRADVIDEHHLALLLAAGSEADKQAYSAQVFRRAEDAIGLSLTLGMRSVEAQRFALTMILRRKGRVLDALTDERAALQRRAKPGDQKVLADLDAARAALANAVIHGPKGDRVGYPARIALLESNERTAEVAASAASAEYRAAKLPLTIESVAKAIPEGAALVEILRIAPTDIHALVDRRWPASYIAYVLHRDGTVLSLQLADAATVDHLAHAFRAALASPDRRDVLDLGSRLYRVTLGRLQSVLDRSKTIFLAPDSELNLVPFAALVDDKGDWLVRRYSFTYLSSGRDLLRRSGSAPSLGGPVIVANPRYDAAAGAPAPGPRPGARGLTGADLSRMRFPPLPGTQVEAEAIGKVLAGATVLTGDQATKTALRALRSPSVLHVATHGFALAAAEPEAGEGRRGVAGPGGAPDVAVEARLRSGLALAGANLHRAGDDGVLTALEAAGLDLDGTKLVVLSACETGVGDVRSGEGVYSLRRAFVEAGAETQMMSLWQVDDDATTTLMAGYYTKLLREGKGRSEALREEQLAMLGDPSTAHPFYWASFTVSGDPTPLDASPGAGVPRERATARGCACEIAPGAGDDSGSCGFLVALLFFATATFATRPPRR